MTRRVYVRVTMESTQHIIHTVDTAIWKRSMVSGPWLVFALVLISISFPSLRAPALQEHENTYSGEDVGAPISLRSRFNSNHNLGIPRKNGTESQVTDRSTGEFAFRR